MAKVRRRCTMQFYASGLLLPTCLPDMAPTPMPRTTTATLLTSCSDAHTLRPLMLPFTRSLLYCAPKVSTSHAATGATVPFLILWRERRSHCDFQVPWNSSSCRYIFCVWASVSARRQWKRLRRGLEVGTGSPLALPSPDLARFRRGQLCCVIWVEILIPR